MVLASAMTVHFSHPEIAVLRGSIGMTVVSTVLFIALCLDCNFWIYESLLVVLLFMLGLTFTASNTLAMNCERANAGVASALLGASGFAFGGIISPLVGLGNILTSTGTAFLIGSVCALFFTCIALRRTYAMVRYSKQSQFLFFLRIIKKPNGNFPFGFWDCTSLEEDNFGVRILL